MIYYCILGAMICTSSIEFFNRNTTREKYIFWIEVIFMSLFCGLRFEVGQDWNQYKEIFELCESNIIYETYERGYILLNRFFHLFTDNYYILQLFIDVAAGLLIFSAIKKKTTYPIFIVLIYYICNYMFAIDMTMNRLHLALAIVICGYYFIDRKNIVGWVCIIFLAMQFHITSVIAFPLFWTSKIKISRKIALISLTICFAVSLMGQEFTVSLMEYIQKIPFLPDRISFLFNSYFYNDVAFRHQELSTGFGLILEYIFYYMIVLLTPKDEEEDAFLLNFIIAIFLQSLSVNFDLLRRLANYYMISGFGIIAYVRVLNGAFYFRGKRVVCGESHKTISYILFLLLIAYRILTFSKAFNSSYIIDYCPYQIFLGR